MFIPAGLFPVNSFTIPANHEVCGSGFSTIFQLNVVGNFVTMNRNTRLHDVTLDCQLVDMGDYSAIYWKGWDNVLPLEEKPELINLNDKGEIFRIARSCNDVLLFP